MTFKPLNRIAIAARIARDYRGQHIGLLAPLVTARKGFYTDLAKWARGKGHSHLRVDGAFLLTQALTAGAYWAESRTTGLVGLLCLPFVFTAPPGERVTAIGYVAITLVLAAGLAFVGAPRAPREGI